MHTSIMLNIFFQCVPPIALIAIYKIVLSKKFDTQYTWFMPTDSEVANAVIHHSDARKHRLQKRFGAPSLRRKLTLRFRVHL